MPSTTLLTAADRRLLEGIWKQTPSRRVLANGLTLLVQREPSAPVASVQVWVRTGSIHEGGVPGSGVSHFLEHMLFKGTERRAGREISASLQACGGRINAYTTFDRTVYYVDLPSVHLELAVDVLADMVLRSTLPAGEFDRERDVILREIDMGRDDPENRLGEALFDTAFREHPYRHPVIGHRDVFSSLTRDELTAYYKTRYTPCNMVVVVAGDVDVEKAAAAVEARFGPEPRRRLAPAPIVPEPVQIAPRERHLHEDVELTRAGLAWPVPGLTHADAPALDLLAALLGHGDSSVLWRTLREKARLVHEIDACHWAPGAGGLFYVSFTCDPEKRARAEAAVRRELDRVAVAGFTVAQMRKAVRQLVVGEINSRKTVSGQASRIGAAEVAVGDPNFGRAYFGRLARVKPADLRRVLGEYLVPARLTSVSLNPKSAAPAPRSAAASAAAQTAPAPIRLPNGARLLLLPDRRLPNLHLRLLCEGGPLHEPAGLRGITSLLATMLTRDTRKRSAAAVAKFIEGVGGAFHSFAGNNSFGLAAEVLPVDLDRALTLLEEAVLQPAFLPRSLEIERDAQVAGLLQDDDDVVTLGRKRLRRLFFGAHPQAIEPAGEAEGLKKVKPADLSALWRRLGVAGNLVLVASGDFDPKVLAPRLKAFLSRLPKGAAPKRPAAFAGPVAGDHAERQPREQAVVFDAFPGPALHDADFDTAEVMDELFSGMSSRLFERVREEKGLAYFVRSARVAGVDAGLFYLFAGTAPGQEQAVLAEFEAEVARVRAGDVSDEELQRCRTRLKAGRRMGLQTNAARAMHAGLNALFDLHDDDHAAYDARIDAVTVAALKDFALRRFNADQRVRLIVRP